MGGAQFSLPHRVRLLTRDLPRTLVSGKGFARLLFAGLRPFPEPA